MPFTLPAPIAAYFEAMNAKDIEATLAPFDESARVTDEETEYRGRPAIRSWMEESAGKYHFTAEVRDAERIGSETVVSAIVSGTFPGSPVMLRYAFTLSGATIANLQIDAFPPA